MESASGHGHRTLGEATGGAQALPQRTAPRARRQRPSARRAVLARAPTRFTWHGALRGGGLGGGFRRGGTERMTTPEGATPFKKKDLNPTYAPDAVTRTTGLKSLDPPTDAEREEMRNGTNGHDSDDHDSDDHDSDDHDSNDQGGEGSDSTTKPVIRVTCAELDVMERQSRSALEKYQPSRPDHERLYTQDGWSGCVR